MHCFIGGSGSTGSSVLANVLNRHSKIFCGPESYLFTKHQLFEDWSNHKEKLINGRLRSFPWHRYSKNELLHPAFGWEIKPLQELIAYSNFIHEFSNEFFGNAARIHKKYYWIEKTPSNVYGFSGLSESFPNCYLIHTIRNPYDTIASLNRRGFSVYYAVAMYLLNTAVGLSMNRYELYYEMVYEDWVLRPEEEIKKLCSFIGMTFEPDILNSTNTAFDEDIESWNLSEKGNISSASIGQFADLSRFVQEEIVYMINALQISPAYIKKYDLKFADIPSICNHFNFKHYEDDGFHNIFQLQIDKTRDHISRIVGSYPSVFSNYPITLK